MEVFGWVLLLILGLITWVVFVPVYLEIDTKKNRYIVTQFGTISFSYIPQEKRHFKVKLFGINVPELGQSKKIENKKKEKKPFIKRSLPTWLFLIKGVLKSFKIKKLVGTADLDDLMLHSQLFAIYPFINQGPVQLTSNLNNVYFLELIIEGRLNKILHTFILFLTKK